MAHLTLACHPSMARGSDVATTVLAHNLHAHTPLLIMLLMQTSLRQEEALRIWGLHISHNSKVGKEKLSWPHQQIDTEACHRMH